VDLPADAELIQRIYARSWSVTAHAQYTVDEITQRLAVRDVTWWCTTLPSAGLTLVAGPVDGGWGFCTVRLGTEAHLDWLYLEPEAHGSSLADALVVAAAQAARAHGARLLHARVLQGNERSRRFAERHGAQLGQPVVDPDTNKRFWPVTVDLG